MGKFLLLAFLGIFLIVSVWWSTWVWGSMGGELSMHGNIALTLGIVVSLIVGIGLMVLLFYSARRGYDATVEYEPPEPPQS
jgi:hypothetical protein